MLDNISNLSRMVSPACVEHPNGSPMGEPVSRCADCGQLLCDHPDPIYGGIAPSPRQASPEAEAQDG